MTILQLRYALECNKMRSISSAAQKQFTTTSNMSKLIKSLEEELGYPIFVRSPYGLIPTEKGKFFFTHASNIINEYTTIEHLEDLFESTHFTVASIPSSFACLAFSELAKSTTKKSGVHIQFNTMTSTEAIGNLKNSLCDIAIIGCNTEDEKRINYQLCHQGLLLEKVAELPVVVYLSEDHPLLQQYTDPNDLLREVIHYPYIEFNNESFLSSHPISPYINKDNVIKINDRVWRLQILRDTNGFAAGADTPSDLRDYGNLYKFCIPNCFFSIFIASNSNQICSNIATQYIDILKAIIGKENMYVSTIRE
ncbi:MAG: transcriptional regulator, LysR family [Anaerocolumna sp.]|jgi:DNA-binding transcriptional LysR family regulator|nr:transcriptional regulator, LysR family [Anaerocolumna sp.]